MDIRIQNQFNNLYIITNNPDDVIPYKYFTNSFNGIPNKDKFKLLSVMGVKEKKIIINEVINKDLVSNIVRPLESIDIIINQLRSVISSLERLKNQGEILDDYKNIDLSVLIESGIKNNSFDVLNK